MSDGFMVSSGSDEKRTTPASRARMMRKYQDLAERWHQNPPKTLREYRPYITEIVGAKRFLPPDQTPGMDDYIVRVLGRPVPERPAFESIFSSDAVLAWRSPCVYLWWRGADCMYVGMSLTGIGRPLSTSHHAIKDFLDGDFLQIFHCAGEDIADLEAWLIHVLKPKRNLAKPIKSVRSIWGHLGSEWTCDRPGCSEKARVRVTRFDGFSFWLCGPHRKELGN